MMKKLVLLTVLFIKFFSFAQDAPEMPKYDSKNAAGLFYYNISEVPKKIKVKDAPTETKTLKALRNYNDKIKKISFLNFSELQQIELTINTLGKKLYSDRDLAEKVSKKVQTTIVPIRDSVVLYEKSLNESLKKFLSKRQLKKWLKYQRAEKRKLIPKRPQNNNPPPQQNMNRRNNRGGMGGRRFLP